MPVSCNPNDLAAAAKCYTNCMSTEQMLAVQTYLLAVIAGGSTDPNVLVQQAKAFQGLRGRQLEVQSYILCQIANQ
jgi:hypothetical protein